MLLIPKKNLVVRSFVRQNILSDLVVSPISTPVLARQDQVFACDFAAEEPRCARLGFLSSSFQRERMLQKAFIFSAFGKPARHLQQHVEWRSGVEGRLVSIRPRCLAAGGPPVLTPAGPG